MDEKIKLLLIAALDVVENRNLDVDTIDGDFATTEVGSMIALQTAFCEAFDTKTDDVVVGEILPKIKEL